MINAPFEKEFVFHDGKRAKNILELYEILERLSDQDFVSFVNSYKNDFANWVEAVLLDKGFAQKLRMSISKEQTKNLFEHRLKELLDDEKSMSIGSRNILKDTSSKENVWITIQNSPVQKPVQNNTLPSSSVQEKVVHDIENTGLKHIHQEIPSHQEHKDISVGAEIKEQSPSSRYKWYEFFKKNMSKKAVDKSAELKEDKLRPEIELRNQEVETNSENLLWMILYGLLIGLIILLLIYKFVFTK